jgi:hypothetical protein
MNGAGIGYDSIPFTYGLFSDAVCSSQCIASDGRMIRKYKIKTNMAGSGRDLIWGMKASARRV